MKKNVDIPVIGIVGPCTAGKSTLILGLKTRDIVARHIAQEHSYVARMWQRITNPDVLIFLDVSYAESSNRKKLNWNEAEYLEQQRRLQHARDHSDLLIHTDNLTPEDILSHVLQFLSENFPSLTANQ